MPTITRENARLTSDTKRGLAEGVGFGLVAGAVMAATAIVINVAAGASPIGPFRLFATILLGQKALGDSVAAGTAIVVGGAVHVGLSALFGTIYGLFNSRMSVDTQTSYAAQAGMGVLYGVALWLFNFQIIARALYPWFAQTPQFLFLMLHALPFGLVLGLFYAGAERSAHHMGAAPSAR